MECDTAENRNTKTKGCWRNNWKTPLPEIKKEQENKDGSKLTLIINNATDRGFSGDAYYIRYSKVNFLATCHDYCVTVY